MLRNQNRRDQRVNVNLSVDVETVLERHHGRITDLSESGAKVAGDPFPVGERVKITANDSVMWGKVRWAEQDRMGIEFETQMPAPLKALLHSRQPANDRARPVFGRKAV